MTYAEKLKDPRWQKKRLEILQRDNFTCQLCLDGETELQVHHKSYHKEPWDAQLNELTTLCKNCHQTETEAKAAGYTVLAIIKIKTVVGALLFVLYNSNDDRLDKFIAINEYNKITNTYENKQVLLQPDMEALYALINIVKNG